MISKLGKTYQPGKTEEKILKFWERGRFAKAKIIKKKKPFVVTLPPPNVTGNLHAGHAMYVIEDIAVRRQRMMQKPTLWLPGFDHASIAVEYLVTKDLKKQGKNKREIGRKEFLKKAKKFASDSRKEIKNQLKKLGFSLDWTREVYTMDKIRSEAVKAAFCNLYDKKLIYRGEYLINWCPGCKTAISDLENEHQEKEGKLYYMKYGPFVLATTRPETKFGDTAVAVNPKDKRYRKWVGKEFVYQSLIGPRKMKVIADKAVDPSFGTGVVKVTPAHNLTDFEIGQRHNLKIVKVIDENGRLTEATGRFAGLKTKEAREKVVKELQEKSEIVKVEKIKHALGFCQRCGTITEPMISKQWFVKTDSLAKKALEAIKQGKIKILPQKYEKVYFHWLLNIKDWCISRQIWWGHQLPVWYCQKSGKSKTKKKYFVSSKKPIKCPFCAKCRPKQIEDTLDTWFSSSLWPISVFGWPKKTKDFKYFYPTSLRETGYDILFFWVSREIMVCLEMTGKIPFKIVYLHGLVRDEQGRKFSKTKGIGFNPLEMTKKYGTDALRLALVTGNAPGNDLKIGEEKIKGYRNFSNKIWNASRFVLSHKTKLKTQKSKIKAAHKDERWILKELDKTIKKVNLYFENYRFDRAAEEIYHFFWHTFCDKYIEMAKKRREETQPTLLYVLLTSLKLLHPFMPFITEEIYQKLPFKSKKKSIMTEQWPI